MNEIIVEAVVSYERGVKAVVFHELGTPVEAVALAGWIYVRLARRVLAGRLTSSLNPQAWTFSPEASWASGYILRGRWAVGVAIA